MLYDLNIAWSPSTSVDDLKRTLKFSLNLGYNVVALNHILKLPIPSKIPNPIPRLTSPPANFPQPPNATDLITDKTKNLDLPTVLRRATVIIDDPTDNYRLREVAAAYEVLALRPTTEKAFQAACTTMFEHSIISLDLTQHMPFYFKPKTCMAAVNKGLRFEICYAQFVGSGNAGGSVESRTRANFIANLMGLVRATKGRGMIISSEAKGPMGLRAPADVLNLLSVWELSQEKGTDALGVNPRGIVMNEGIKRRGFRGMIDVVDSEGQIPNRPIKGKDTVINGDNTTTANIANGKRKHDEKGVGQVMDVDGAPAMSKRQAKKLRLAEAKKEAEPNSKA